MAAPLAAAMLDCFSTAAKASGSSRAQRCKWPNLWPSAPLSKKPPPSSPSAAKGLNVSSSVVMSVTWGGADWLAVSGARPRGGCGGGGRGGGGCCECRKVGLPRRRRFQRVRKAHGAGPARGVEGPSLEHLQLHPQPAVRLREQAHGRTRKFVAAHET